MRLYQPPYRQPPTGSHWPSLVDRHPLDFKAPLQTWGSRRGRGLSPNHYWAPLCSEKPEPGPAERQGLFKEQDTPVLLCSDSKGSQGHREGPEASVKALASSLQGMKYQCQVVRCHPVTLCTKRTSSRSGGEGGGSCGDPGCRHSVLQAQAEQPAWARGQGYVPSEPGQFRTKAKPKFLEEGKEN